jgi:type IV pilus assembly protein PilW
MRMPMTAMNRFASATRQAGLTLVELMVALTLGLFLTLGLILMMSDSSRTFKIQDDYARMQESAVASLRFISDSLRHTGFYGLASSTLTLDPYGTIGTITNDCGATLTSGVPLFGYADTTTAAAANAALPCIPTSNFRGTGPILIARLGTGQPVPDPNSDGNFADGIAAQPNFTNTLYLQSDANFGYVFRGGDFAGLVSANLVKRFATGNQFPVFPYQMHVYYVRPCSRPTGGTAPLLQCQASDDGGRPIPTLVRQELDAIPALTMVERPLAEGVERIHFTYGLDTLPAPDGDGIADRFVADPLSVSADGWTRVVAVRVSLLVRSPTPIAGQDDSGKNYDLDGDGTADFNCTDATVLALDARACDYKRAFFSQLIQVRNVAFRRGA